MRKKTIVLTCVAAFALALGVGGYFALNYEPGADDTFDTHLAAPTFAQKHPRVLFDHGHHNGHSISGRFRPFAKLLRADGCTVVQASSPFTATLLDGCDVLVIVNACAPKPERERPAFTDAEVAAVKEWVSSGGSLLLVADHHPYGVAAADLARVFSVRMIGGWCDDEANLLVGTADSGAIAFDRAKGGLGEHAILQGRGGDERVNVVATFTGQSLVAPDGATPLLKCADTALDRVPIASKSVTAGGSTTTTFETADSSASGHCQGLAMPFGKGRVVVLGEAAMLTAQIDRESGLKFGMNVAGIDNRDFALNVVRWLAGALGQ